MNTLDQSSNTNSDDVEIKSQLPKKFLKQTESYLKQVAKNNAKFKKLGKKAKRVAIAKDVIKQIEAKRLVPESGMGYLQPRDYNLDLDEFNVSTTVDLQIGAVLAGQTCDVCALGALFMSTIDIRDKATCESLTIEHPADIDQEDIHTYLEDIFSKEQLYLIEDAFESYGNSYEEDYEVVDITDRACNFGLKYSKADKRLVAIMKNIILNEGTFKP